MTTEKSRKAQKNNENSDSLALLAGWTCVLFHTIFVQTEKYKTKNQNSKRKPEKYAGKCMMQKCVCCEENEHKPTVMTMNERNSPETSKSRASRVL